MKLIVHERKTNHNVNYYACFGFETARSNHCVLVHMAQPHLEDSIHQVVGSKAIVPMHFTPTTQCVVFFFFFFADTTIHSMRGSDESNIDFVCQHNDDALHFRSFT